MDDLNKITKGLFFRNGVWYSDKKTPVSSPLHGNEFTFQYEEKSFWYRHRNNIIVESIKNTPPKGNKILEIGGGNGFIGSELLKNGFNVTIIEPSSIGINNCINRGIKNLICSTYEDTQISDNSISAIALFDVVEHIDKDLDFLNQINKVLVHNGKLYLTVPAFNFLFSEEDIIGGHFRRYSRKELITKVEAAGFKIEYVSYFFFFLPIPLFFFRTLPSILNIKRKESIDIYIKENRERKRLLGKLISWILDRELQIIKKGKKLFTGSSLLLIASKNKD